ncbi:MAG: NlpC/P60 family protein [Candidatus Methylopumilus sp.]|nr:NlpC/P60 family protein [Candidatus Methylopumilus sp.]
MKKIQITLIALLIGVYQTTVAADFNLPWSNDKVNGEKSQSIEATVSEPASWSNYAQDVILSALSLMGVKYSWGGKTPEGGLDCSGFVRFVFQQATNLTLPHGARALSQLGTNVSNNDLQPGDLVFFNTLKSSFSHVGIYIGNNRFIHAPRTGREVVITDMTESYWAKRFNGARRIDPRDLASVEANPNTQIK